MLDILNRIWAGGHGSYVWLPRRLDGTWFEGSPFELPLESIEYDDRSDLYFTPLTFDSPTRLNTSVAEMPVLYADIDTGLTDLVRPTILWETSPGSFQGVWVLSYPILPNQFKELNRDLTYHIKADKGGWHASKVLRIPGTLNWKHARYTDDGLAVPRGRLIHDDGPEYSPERLRYLVPVLPSEDGVVVVGDGMPPIPGGDNYRKLLAMEWAGLPISVRSWMLQTYALDRSRLVWQCATVMASIGLAPMIAFQLISGTAWNKYKDRPLTLWKTVNKAYLAYRNHLNDSQPDEGSYTE